MTDHPYHSIGAQKDRAKTWQLLDRIAGALERVADALETQPLDKVIIPRIHPSATWPGMETGPTGEKEEDNES